MKTLVVATGNFGKLKEMESYLKDISNISLALKPPELDIQETGLTFAENARLKASQTAKTLNQWAIADDSGLMVTALQGQPGIYSARYGDTDTARITRLLHELQDKCDRTAKFVCAVAVANEKGEIILETEGVCEGEILTHPTGEGGFGYDPVFFVPQVKQTFAQMPPELKKKLSHRGKAFATLQPLLKSLLSKY